MASFKVIIVGGSVAGLTLANILERYQIDYIVLEKHASAAPQLGASLGFLPPGARILDQLGLFSRIEALSMSINESKMVGPDGLQLGSPQQVGEIMEELLGYRMGFLDRRMLLQVLFDGIHDKSKIFLSREVLKIENLDEFAQVTLTDGTVISGDIVVGADGVHSRVRTEMWRIWDVDMNYNSARAKQSIICKYKCIFGISNRPSGIPDNASFRCFQENRSYFCASGPDNKMYFFGFFRNATETTYLDIPRYTSADAKDLITAYSHDPLFHGLTFGDLYGQKTHDYLLVPLEEFVLERCFYKRSILIGDSFHKMNPLGGQGGNSAIESASMLADLLKKTLDKNPHPKNSIIEQIFNNFQEDRHHRTVRLMKFTQRLQRMEMLENRFLKFLQLKLVPKMGGQHIVLLFASESTPGKTLEFLPQTYRYGKIPLDQDVKINTNDRSTFVTLAWVAVMFGIAAMGLFLSSYLGVHESFDESGLLQIYLSFISITVNGVWVVESYRPSLLISPLCSAIPYTLISFAFGLVTALPIYFILHIYMSGQKPFYFPSPRAIDPRVAKALPGTLLIAYFPFMALAAANSGQPRESTQYVLKLGLMCFPILLQFGGNIYRKSSPRLSAGQLLFESRDMKYLLRFFGLIAFSTTAIHLFFITKLLSMVSLDPSNLGMMTLYLFQVGYWTLLINIWGMFVVWDLRRVNATEVTLPVSLLFLFMTSVLAGPATTLTVSWVWRDLTLQKGRQRKTNKCGERTD